MTIAPPEPSRIGNLLPAIVLFILMTAGWSPAIAEETGHHAPSEKHQHQHPAPTPEQTDAVALDEKLGSPIPLDLSLRDEQGREVQLRDLITKPTIIAPVYYRCPNVCNFLQAGLAQALPKMKLKPGQDYQVLSFSFDETEKPDLAASSKKNYFMAMGSADFPEDAWRFLTADKQTIMQLTGSAGYRFQRQGVEFLHPVAVFVVSPEGKIVRYLHGTRFLPMDLTLSLVEASEGRVGSTIRKMVSLCFSYDPEKKTYVFNLLRVSATVVLLTAGSFLAVLIFTGKKKKQHRN